MENGVLDGEGGAHCYYIIFEFSSRQLVVLVGTGRGVPRDSMRQLAGITDMQRGGEHIHCFCWLPLNLKHLFQMSFSSKTLWYLVKFRVIIVPLHHQGGQGNQSIQGDQGDHNDRKVKSR